MAPPDYLSDIIPREILLIFFNHLDLPSIFKLRRAGKKIKEKTDTVLSSTVPTYIDLQKASQLHPDKPYTYRYFRRYPETRETNVTFPLSSSANSERTKKILLEINKSPKLPLEQLEKYSEFIRSRIIYYLENNNFIGNELEYFEKSLKAIIPKILSSKELISTTNDDKLFFKMLMILHHAIKNLQKEKYVNFDNFLSTFISYLITFSAVKFLTDLLTEDQICSLLGKGYDLGKKHKEIDFFTLFREIAIITGPHLTANLLFFIADFIDSTQLKAYAARLIPAIINFYQEEPIVTPQVAEKAFIVMGFKEKVLPPKILMLSDCLEWLYPKNILKNTPAARQDSQPIFNFLNNLIDSDPSINEPMLMASARAAVILFQEEPRPKISLEMVFLFNAGKLFADVEPLAETLILSKKTPQANITMETIETWIIESQQTIPKEYYKNWGSQLIYDVTKAILALCHMNQLDDKGVNNPLFQQNLVKQEIKEKIFQAVISFIKKPEVQPYLDSFFVPCLLKLYLFSLYFEIPKSLDEIATHFNNDSRQMRDKINIQFNPLIEVYQLSFPLIKQVATILLQRHFSNEDFEKLMFMAKNAPKEANDWFSELIKNENPENFLKIMQQIEEFNELYLHDSSESDETSDDEDSDSSFHI